MTRTFFRAVVCTTLRCLILKYAWYWRRIILLASKTHHLEDLATETLLIYPVQCAVDWISGVTSSSPLYQFHLKAWITRCF